MFSKTCEYGIRAMIYIATQSLEGQRVKIGDVIKNTGSPEAFTAKILGALVRSELIESLTGPHGGFYIDKTNLKKIKVSHIVSAIDGDTVYEGCGLGLAECSDLKPCPMHSKFVAVRGQLKRMLQSTSVYDLAIGLKEGRSVLAR